MKRHQQLYERLVNASMGHRDHVLTMLVVSIMAYTPDFLDLDHRREAENVQMTFASLLHRQEYHIQYLY